MPGSDKVQAAKDLQKLGALLKGVLAIGPDLELWGQMEKTVEPRGAEIDDLRAKQSTLEADIYTRSAAIAEREEAAKDIISKATKQALQIKADAEAAASVVKLQAQTKVAEILDGRRAEEGQLLAAIDAAKQGLKDAQKAHQEAEEQLAQLR